MTLGDPLLPKTSLIFAIFIVLHIFVESKHTDFMFGVQVDRS